jgi:hypothetical protein
MMMVVVILDECTSVNLYNRAKTLDVNSIIVKDVAILPVDIQNVLREIFLSALGETKI